MGKNKYRPSVTNKVIIDVTDGYGLGLYPTRAIARKVKKFHEEVTGYRCSVNIWYKGTNNNINWIDTWMVTQTTTPLKGK